MSAAVQAEGDVGPSAILHNNQHAEVTVTPELDTGNGDQYHMVAPSTIIPPGSTTEQCTCGGNPQSDSQNLPDSRVEAESPIPDNDAAASCNNNS